MRNFATIDVAEGGRASHVPSMDIAVTTKEETKPHVLVVEDARDIREPLARYLREHGYRATTAADAAGRPQGDEGRGASTSWCSTS